MKKNIILSAVIGLTVGGTLAVAFASTRNASPIALTKAAEKTFTFDATVGANQFEDQYPSKKPAEISVVTGVSSNLETKVYLTKNAEEDFSVGYGDNGRFVRSWETFSNSDLTAEIGVNNLTSIDVVYGCDKTEFTKATAVYCYIDVYDEEGGWHNDQSGSNGSSFNTDLNLNWNKTMSGDYVVTKVRVRVGASGGSIYFGEPIYIKSMTLNWSC